MDENKLEVLRAIKYKIRAACGSCQYGKFRGGSDFGVCLLRAYDHRKHAGAPRQLSIYRYGGCGEYAISQLADLELCADGGGEEFAAKRRPKAHDHDWAPIDGRPGRYACRGCPATGQRLSGRIVPHKAPKERDVPAALAMGRIPEDGRTRRPDELDDKITAGDVAGPGTRRRKRKP